MFDPGQPMGCSEAVAGLRAALVATFAIASGPLLFGCGYTAQTLLGWRSDPMPVQRKEEQPVHVSTNPAGAEIHRVDADGQTTQLGPAPLTDRIVVERSETRRSPQVLGLWLGGLSELGLSAGAFYLARGEEKCFGPDDCFRTKDPNMPLYVTGGALVLVALSEFIVAMAHGSARDDIQPTAVSAPPVEYQALKPGYLVGRASVDAAKESRVRLRLSPKPPPRPPPPKQGPSKKKRATPASERRRWVVAVVAVEAEQNEEQPRQLIERLGDQIRVFVTQRGCRTIDRTSQEEAFARFVKETKIQSYDECYDEACQIELGRALSATHVLRASLLRFGSRCVLNAELVDLAQEVSIAAASSQGGCEEEGFLTMSEDVAKQLLP